MYIWVYSICEVKYITKCTLMLLSLIILLLSLMNKWWYYDCTLYGIIDTIMNCVNLTYDIVNYVLWLGVKLWTTFLFDNLRNPTGQKGYTILMLFFPAKINLCRALFPSWTKLKKGVKNTQHKPFLAIFFVIFLTSIMNIKTFANNEYYAS